MLQNNDIKNISPSERLYDELKKIVGEGKLTSSNIVTILISLMQIVENYDVKGTEKKAIILDVLDHLIDDTMDAEEAKNLKSLIQFILPSVIDTFISLDKKEIVIKLKKSLSKFFSCCGCE